MHDEDDQLRSRAWATVMAVAALLPMTSGAEAQRLHGVAELQYQNQDRAGSAAPIETWGKSVQMDYATRLPGAIEFTSRMRFNEQTIAGRPDRLRTPEGSLRLAHRNFGISTTYRPSENRDARNFTARQQTLSLTGYVQNPGLPSVSGSWIRNHVDPNVQSPGSATVTRSLSGSYALPHLSVRAGYGDRSLETEVDLRPRVTENSLTLGSASQFQVRRASISLQYDFNQARSNPSGLQSFLSRAHTAGGTGSLQISSKTSSNLGYSFRRTDRVGTGRGPTEEHNGSLSLSHSLSQAVQTSAGAGVRSASFGGRNEIERFVSASASAQGQARAGWRMSASAARSLNWLPGASARTADNFQSNTTMHLTNGLDARGHLSISTGRRPVVTPDTTESPRSVALDTGAGITATPLRTVSLDASFNRGRAGTSLLSGGSSVTSYSTRLRLTPTPRMQLSSGWALTKGSGSRGTTLQASMQWTPSSLFQASGSYGRSRQEISALAPPITAQQESFSGSLTMALGRDLNGTVRYSESNWGRPTHVRQLGVNVAHNFGR